MITVIVNIDLYRYEIHSLLKAFYPREDVKVLTEADAAGSRKYQQIAREPFLRVVFAEKNITLSFCDGSDQRAAAVPGDLPADRKSQELKTLLKHLLYDMLSKREERTLPWGELIGIRPTKIAAPERPCSRRRSPREKERSSPTFIIKTATASMWGSLFVRRHVFTALSRPLTWRSGRTEWTVIWTPSKEK